MFVTNIVLEGVTEARKHHGGGDTGHNNVRDSDVMVIAIKWWGQRLPQRSQCK